ncbi:TVP38/TMEM64 family protein, partial [Patulibacter sp. S7RM1-6]
MRSRRGAAARLVGLLGALSALAAVFLVGGLVGADEIRAWIAPAGAWGPLAFVLVSGALGAVLVPGAALSAAAGLLFGAVPGALLALPSAVLT